MRVFVRLPPNTARLSPDAIAGADAMIVDRAGLETLRARPVAEANSIALFLRTSAVDAPGFEAELAAAMPARPDAIMLPVRRGCEVAQLGAHLAVQEAENGWPDVSTRIVAMLECAQGVLHAASLLTASTRLAAIGWDADALASELGLADPVGGPGLNTVLAQARAQVRLVAAAAHILAVETAYPESDATRFRQAVAEACRDGFGAIIAIGAEQTTLAGT